MLLGRIGDDSAGSSDLATVLAKDGCALHRGSECSRRTGCSGGCSRLSVDRRLFRKAGKGGLVLLRVI